jgi:hypothetical protein
VPEEEHRQPAGTSLMADLLPTDVLLVNRAGVDYKVTKANLMATVQDTDLLLVNRAGVDYKATFADVKKGFGGGKVSPKPSDVSSVPAFAGGTGTQADPYILSPITVGSGGGSGKTVELITIANVNNGDVVQWTDNSAGAGQRFKQPVDITTGTTWSGRLQYLDTPNSSTNATYTGDIQIGTTYFRWVVTQETGVAPDIDAVALSDATSAGRFTSSTFPIQVEMAKDGSPTSTKKLKAWVEGSLKASPVSSAITNVSGGTSTTLTLTDNTQLVNFAAGDAVTEVGNGNNGTGTVTAVDATAKTITLSPAGGTWDVGSKVQGPKKTLQTQFKEPLVSHVAGTSLVFAAGTDMSALAPADAVSQSYSPQTDLITKVTVSLGVTDPATDAGTTFTFNVAAGIAANYGAGAGTSFKGALYVVPSAGNSLMKSTNGGTSWSSMADPESGGTIQITGVFANSSSQLLLATFSGVRSIYRSTDGSTWAKLTLPFTQVGKLAVNRDVFYSLDATKVMWQSSDGATWTKVPGFVAGPWSSTSEIAVGKGGQQFLATNGTTLYGSVDGGKTWSSTAAGGPCYGLAFDGENFWAGGGSPAWIYKGSPNNMQPIAGVSGQTVSCVGFTFVDRYIIWAGYSGGIGIIDRYTNAIAKNPATALTGNAEGYLFDPTTNTYYVWDASTQNGMKMQFSATTLEFASDQNLSSFAQNVSISLSTDATVKGNVGTTDSATRTMIVYGSTGTWALGSRVIGPPVTTTGAVGSIAGTTVNLSASTGTWVNGQIVTGPVKASSKVRLYCTLNGTGNVTDLQSADPGFTTWPVTGGPTTYNGTVTFPATLPSGQPPDTDLPAGTHLQVEVEASNASGSDTQKSITITPA